MTQKSLEQNIVSDKSTLKEALLALNQGVNGVVFVVDDQHRVQGIYTDGDIRRAFLSGATLSSSVSKHMNTRFVFARQGQPREDYIHKLSDQIRHLPILDDHGRLVDFLSWAEFWKKPVMSPALGGNELKYVSDCITSNWISSQGEYVRRFEHQFAKYHGATYAVSTMNCTCALHLCLAALGIGPGDEVIVPDLTFAATANAVIHTGARPVLVDVHPEHWTINPSEISKAITSRTKAIMPVHLYGFACDMGPLLEIAREHGLFVIEDCAEALGTKYKSHPVGILGDMGCFSFFSNKIITTGEGGMILTDDRRLHDKLIMLRDHGMSRSRRYWHEAVGYNYRMTNLQAAVGLAQMEQIDLFLRQRARIAGWYKENLQNIPGIVLPSEAPWAERVMWLYTVLLPERLSPVRTNLIKRMLDDGIETRPMFYPLHMQPPYQNGQTHCPVSISLSRRGLSLPSSIDLKEQEVVHICEQLRKAIDRTYAFTGVNAALELHA